MDEKKEEEKESEGEIGYAYSINPERGTATFPCEVDSMGKIHLPKFLRQRLNILRGAEVEVVLEVKRRYE